MHDEEEDSRRTDAEDGIAVRTLTLHEPLDAAFGGIGSASRRP
jgi:hypothetical protein